jgi:hypothetical protein
MFAQSVNENIGGTIDKAAQNADDSGRLTLIVILLFISFITLFIVIMYLARRRYLSKSDRKAKVLHLP